MSTHSMTADGAAPGFYVIDEEEHHGPGASTSLGFWIYLMSDALIFATLFATYGVLSTSYAGGPAPRQIFELPLVAVNTAMLLLSSITFGMAAIAADEERPGATRLWLGITALFGAAFVGIELYEFASLIAEGATPQRSAFLSGFFALVGTHGLHVLCGLIWIGVMLVQMSLHGLNADNRRRLMCLGMFWHLLDVVWIGVFTFVYLLGVLR
ncbi:cytochrome o ubiquinol oxidase subunit III [Microvirga sp. SRT01]|jgi:cytochrome o ubiquinol oxidase subunit 3|nr:MULTISPECIES: cytochrome o ubiquinol oxidase subunit III [Alphaproteobacteria]MBR7709074.1 cytochrome o ubiquinol oxidase subunit III [Microvirga sp. SRT01]